MQVFTDEPERRFAPESVLYTEDGSSSYVVGRSRTFKNRWIVLFKGAADRTAAEALGGLELYVQADGADELAGQDAWYPKDLIGLEVRLAQGNGLGLPANQHIGTVTDILDGSAQPLLRISLSTSNGSAAKSARVSGETNSALIPFVAELVPEIDADEGYLSIDPPGGLIPGLG